MTTTDMPPLPSSDEVDATIKHVTDHAERVFLWNYDRSRDQLVTLYNKAMSSQWNSITELDWSTDVDPEELVNTSPQQNLTVQIARVASSRVIYSVSRHGNYFHRAATRVGTPVSDRCLTRV